MRKVISIVVVHAFLLICVGEGCISTFADLEHELVTNPANKHQLSRAFFPLRHEVNPVCITSYYYVGINSSSIDKQSCSLLNMSDEGENITGCEKWQWCINSFYMAIDLPQLQDLSFYIILDSTTDVVLELPPLCSDINDIDTITQHFQRVTASLYQYARNKGQLGNGTEFVGYAARFRENSDRLEKMTYNYDSQEDSIDKILRKKHYSIDLYSLHSVILLINLLSLPMLATSLILFAHVDYIKSKITSEEQGNRPQNQLQNQLQNQPQNQQQNQLQNHAKRQSEVKNFFLSTLKYYLMFGFVMICISGTVAMVVFQYYAFTNKRKMQKYYEYPYICLWIMVVVNLIISTFLIIVEEEDKGYKIWFKCIVLGAGTMAMQVASWHLVFVLYGLILNPLRAFLYSVAIIIAVLWGIVLLALLSLIFYALLIFPILKCIKKIIELCLKGDISHNF